MSYLTEVVVGAVVASGLWLFTKRLTATKPLSNLPGPKPKSWLYGSIPDLFNVHSWDYHIELSEKYGRVFKFMGFFSAPSLYVLDPKAMHHILIKDLEFYPETPSFLALNNIFFGKGLLSTEGAIDSRPPEKWLTEQWQRTYRGLLIGDLHRKQRKMLNPVFSMGHMRRMLPTFYEVVRKLRDTLTAKAKDGQVELDLLTWMTRTALELIGQSGLGYSFDPLTEDGQQHPYSAAVKSLLGSLAKIPFSRHVIVPLTHNWGTARLRRLVVDFLSLFWGDLRHVRDLKDIMAQTTAEIYEAKKKAFAEGGDAFQKHAGKGNDLITILMKANMAASEEDRLPEDQVMGQISSFTFAAMDTTSSALSRIFHILSEHPDFQERLRQEIRDAKAKKGGDLEYDDLMGLPLLDATCRETLRIYTPVVVVLRVAGQDCVLPVSKPIVGIDGKEMNEVFVPKGTNVIVGSYTANRNVDLWGPDAHEWKPERWLSPLPHELVDAKIPGVYSHLMTFIGGSRSCIGFKFSELEMKVVISEVLDAVRILPTDKKIVWHNTGVAHPAVDEKAQLPVRIELAA